MQYWTNQLAASPVDSSQKAAKLLNQQIWCWGRDIECASGNWLVEYGFERTEKPAGSKAASLYRLELAPNSRIVLRGFGIFCGDDRWGGMFLPRFEFDPMFTPAADLLQPAWSTDHLPPLFKPQQSERSCCIWLLLMLIDWICDYETWIANQVGLEYRAETLREWQVKQEPVPAEQMCAAWRMLSVAVSDHPQRFVRCMSGLGLPSLTTNEHRVA